MITSNRVIGLTLACCLFVFSACDSNDDPGQCDLAFSAEDVVVGDGEEAVVGKTVSVHYTGYLCDESAAGNKGAKFDSSVDRGVPFNFVLGAGAVIDGWGEGIPGMKVGGHRVLTIPPEKAYGNSGAGDAIPPNATLIFEVELLGVN
jgi:FKBP-type peptidyl-prolyl cis-trans isomerase FkpA